jgi:uncharacterized protein YbaP (TraB family)
MKSVTLIQGLAALVTAALPLGTARICAEEAAHPDRPMLWSVESAASETPSYLFGTVHMSNPRIAKLHPAAERAFDQAAVLMTEITLDVKEQIEGTALMMRGDGSKLSESIGEELSAQLEKVLKDINPALGVELFEPMKTWAAAMGVVMLPYQLKGDKALDQILWDRAKAAGKTTDGLETLKQQVAAFEILNEEEQVTYLRETITNLEENRKLLEQLIGAYEKGDDKVIEELMLQSIRDFGKGEKERELGERLLKSLLTDRDVSMAATIDKTLREAPAKSHFFAVGAAHLLGDASILKHLEKKGYKITRITE